MKFWTKVVAKFAVYSNFCIVGVYLGPSIFTELTRVMVPRSFIAEVDTPSYTNHYTEFVLNQFNELGNRRIVTFERNANGRPINIREMPHDMFFTFIQSHDLGIAFPTLDSCTIYLRKGMSYAIYREVLIHEYLHCMNYKHSEDQTDIMYLRENDLNKEASIIEYAKDLERKYYGK